MSIGEKIFELRKDNKLSQEQLAEKISVTRQTISKWELGETAPDLKQARDLSKELNISLDELVDNDIKNVLVEKVSNTEKLAGVVLKALKWILGIFIGMLVIDIIIFALFIIFKKQPISDESKQEILNCSIANKEYVITIGDGTYFDCPECSKNMSVYLKDITDWANLETSVKNINKYFKDNSGTCK